MSESNVLAQTFESQRDRLHAVAYRMLGSHADADDVVQDAWLRLSRQQSDGIDNLAGWLTTVVGRLSLDVLRGRRTHPEMTYDEPELTIEFSDDTSLEEEAALADSVGLALLVVLDTLKPSERLAFVLHDLFAVPFEEIGQILGKSPDAAKMLASRARRKVRAEEKPQESRASQRAVVDAFLAAARGGDFEGLLKVLDPDVRLNIDGADGVIVRLGATEVASAAKFGAAAAARAVPVIINGLPGIVSWREDGAPLSAMAFAVSEGRVLSISTLTDPDRLAALDLPHA